jgi:hypothetical protein
MLVLIVFETLSMPLKMTPVRIHPYYTEITARPAAAVLELPPRDRSALLHQTVHEKKILAVRRAYPRSPQRSHSFWRDQSFRGFMDTLFRREKILNLSSQSFTDLASEHRSFLTSHGIGFVTVTKDAIPERERKQTLRVLRAMEPENVLEDDELAIFEY